MNAPRDGKLISVVLPVYNEAGNLLSRLGALGTPKGLAVLAAGLLAWVSFLSFPSVAQPTLDNSWVMSLGFFLKNRLQAGQDWAFTFGPLGYLQHSVYYPGLFGAKVLWEIGMKLVFAALLLAATLRLAGRGVKLAFFATCVAVLDHDSLPIFGLLLFGCLMLKTAARPAGVLLAGAFFLALLSLVKFNGCIFALVVLGVVSTHLWGNRHAQRAWYLLPLGFLGFFLALWVACGQRLANLPRYLWSSWQMASGYDEGMSLEGTGGRWQIPLAIIILAILGTSFAVDLVRRAAQRRERVLLIIMAATGLFLCWKHGFVRHDRHSLHFFAFAALLPLLVWNDGEPRPRIRRLQLLMLSVCAALGLGGYVAIWSPSGFRGGLREFPKALFCRVRGNLANLFSIPQMRQECQRKWAAAAVEHDLPETRKLVGANSVDTLSWRQGQVLLNGLNWRPHPVFQSYLAYTPYLLKANEAFFSSARAPRFVLLSQESIDAHFPTLENGMSLMAVLSRYRPVLNESPFLLMENSGAAGAAPQLERLPVLSEARVKFGERLAMHGSQDQIIVASLDARLSMLGRLRRLLLRSPPLLVNIETDAGQSLRFRLVPSMARQGFLLSPLLMNDLDVLRLYGGKPGTRVTGLSFTTLPGMRRFFQNKVRVVLREFPKDLVPSLGDDAYFRLTASVYPMFHCPLEAIRSKAPPERKLVDGREVLQVHADGEVSLRRLPEARTLRGRFGIIPEAYTRGRTDGVRFVVELRPVGGTPVVLFDRYLDPVRQAGDRGFQDFSVELPGEIPGEIVLRTSAGPANNTSWDWSYWVDVEVK